MPLSLVPPAFFGNTTRNLRLAKTTVWVAYLGLILSLLCDGLLAGTHPLLLLVAIVPLLIFLPGLYRQDHRSLVMLCFVSLLYFTVIVVNLFEPDKTLFSISALVTVILLFITAMMYSRWLRAKQHLDKDNPSQGAE